MDKSLNNSENKLENNEKWKLKDYLKAIGPAAVIAAVVIGPGSVTTGSSMGAKFGYEPLWIIVLACIFSYFYQEPAIRITLTKNISLMEAVKERISPTIAKILYIMVLFGTIAFQAGNFIGASMAMNFFVPQVSLVGWTTTMAVLGLLMSWRSAYNSLENITRILIGLMVAAFVITAIASGPSITDIAVNGFSFKIPGGNWLMVLALLSTTMVPDIPLSLSALIKEKYCNTNNTISLKSKTRFAKVDLTVSLLITALITLAIIICSATILHPQGITISSAADMALQLTPLLGRYAGILFSLGLWAAGFSSGLFRMSLMAMLFNQSFGYEVDLKAKRSRIIMLLTSIIPIIIVIIFGSAPVQLIVTAQALNGILLPVICGIVWKLSNDKEFLGENVNSKLRNIIVGILMILTTLLAIRVFINILGLM